MIQKNDSSILRGWCMYDWANSVYSLTITTAIFPLYFISVAPATVNVPLVGGVKSSALYSYAISFSFLVVAFLSPLLSGITDYGGYKLKMMKAFTILGSTSCCLLFFFDESNIWYGISMSVLASIGYAGALVFYNSYLPDIATPDEFDRLSARGFSLGYIGSVILLLVNLLMVVFELPSEVLAKKIAFVLVGIWWFGFSRMTFIQLEKVTVERKQLKWEVLGKGFKELQKVFAKVRKGDSIKTFLMSFLFYSMGVQTIMYLAPLFGEQEVGIEGGELIIVVLLLQLLAIAGASGFARVSDRKGNKYALVLMLLIWVVICVCSYFVKTKIQFYVLASLVGAVMGGIQSLSRSTYSKLIPQTTNDTVSYFSFYDFTEKWAIVLGTFSFGFIADLTDSMRNSSIMLSVFFIMGLLILSRLKRA